MKTFPCKVCSRPVTEDEIRSGSGAYVRGKGAFCSEHMTPQRVGGSTRRNARVSAAAAGPAKVGNQKMIILGMAGAAVLLVVILVAVIAGRSKEPVKPVKTVKQAEKDTENVKANLPAEPDKPADKGVAKDSQEADKGGEEDLGPVYAAIAQKAEDAFDGTIPSFKALERALKAQVIDADRFAETEYPARAAELLENSRTIVNTAIQEVFDKMLGRIDKLAGDLDFKQALAAVDTFPAEYRSFGEWNARLNELRQATLGRADEACSSWISDAKEKARDQSAETAIAFLHEFLDVGKGRMLDDMVARLEKEIAFMKAGDLTNAPGGHTEGGAAAMLAMADTLYQQGDWQEAEKLYTQLMGSFRGDAAVAPRVSDLTQRLGVIEASKKENPDSRLSFVYFDDFEKQCPYNVQGTYDIKNALNSKGRSLKAETFKDNKWFACGVGADNYNHVEIGMFKAPSNGYFAMWYYVEGDTKGGIKLQCSNVTQGKQYTYYINKPFIGTWSFFCAPMADMQVLEDKTLRAAPGDVFSSIKMLLGEPNGKEVLYIDDLAIVSGTSRYNVKPKLTAKRVIISEITSDRKKDFYKLDVVVLDRAAGLVGKDRSLDKVLAFGGLHVKSSFLTKTGARVVTESACRKPDFTTAVAPDVLKSVLAADKPAIVAFFIGTNDIMAGLDIDTFADRLEPLIVMCIENRTVPVLFTLPHILEEPEMSGRIPIANDRIRFLADKYELAYVDGYGMFQEDMKGVFADKFNLKLAGYRRINEAFARIFEAYTKYAFK